MKHVYWYHGHDCVLQEIARADNCYLYTAAGDRYVDLESGVWCTVIGHSNKRITEVIKERAGNLMHSGYCYSNPVAETAACDVLNITGINEGKCVFLLSGSEAVEFCVRAIRAVTGRQRMLVLADSYLGAYDSINTSNTESWYRFDWTQCRTCEKADSCDPDCPLLRTIPFESIGGFVLEPGSASGVIHFPSESLVKNISDATRKNGGLIAANEVTTGMGRTGRWFGFQHTGIKPDMVAIGKGLGNGYPVSAAAFSSEVSEKIERSDFHSSQSHQNDPLGAAVAHEVISVIRENRLLDRGTQTGAYMLEEFSRLKEQYSLIKEVRGRGMMMAVELKPDIEASIPSSIHAALMQRRFIIVLRPGLRVFRIDPCLTIPQEEVDGFIAAFREIISEIRLKKIK